MKKLCAIISGGRRAPLDGIENADLIVACDKGYQYAEEAGVRPQLLVGDFDSYTGSLPADIPILDLPVEKDDTDTMAAIRYAVQEDYSEIVLYCALGGRLDHLLGNVQSAVFAVERGCRVHIIDTDNLLYFFTDGALTLPPREGWSLSLLSLTDRRPFCGLLFAYFSGSAQNCGSMRADMWKMTNASYILNTIFSRL